MLVNGKIEKETYHKLMHYLFDKCDCFSVNRRYDQNEDYHCKIRMIILNNEGITEKTLSKRYSLNYVNDLIQKYQTNKELFDDLYVKNHEAKIKSIINKRVQKYKNFDSFKKSDNFFNNLNMSCNSLNELNKIIEKNIINNRSNIIKDAIESYIHDNNIEKWLNKNKDYIIGKRNNPMIGKNNFIYNTEYFIKLNDITKREILEIDGIFNWRYPIMIEDFCLFKNGYCLLSSTTHEEKCEIFCKNEEEYEYFKSIGIKFVNSKYIYETMNDLYHDDYIEKISINITNDYFGFNSY